MRAGARCSGFFVAGGFQSIIKLAMDGQPSVSILQVRLLGSLDLVGDDQSLSAPASTKVRSLLAYLILNHDRPLPRDRLTGLFWPDRSDARARRALSQGLWQIRSTLGPAADRLVAEREFIAFVLRSGDRLDVTEFEEKVYKCTGVQVDKALSTDPLSTCLLELSEAVALYRADFLENIYDDWTLLERERLRELYLGALERLVTLHKQRGDYEQALTYAQRLAAADPLREAAHRELMRLYHLLGRSQAALEQFAVLRDLLAEELGIPPTPATVALYQEIVAVLEEAGAPHLPVAPPPPPLLRDLSHLPLVGRADERARLLYALQMAAQGRGGLALVEGDAGVGKSRLIAEVIADAQWRGFQVGIGKAEQLAGLTPYQLLRDAVSPLLTPLRIVQLAELVEPVWLSAASAVLPVIAEHLIDLPVLPSLDPQEEQRRLWEGLGRCLAGMATISPLLLVLEDVHWADEATLAALSYLAPRLSTARAFIILTCRTAEAREQGAVWQALEAVDRALPLERLRLRPFERAEGIALVSRALGTGGADAQATAFAERLQDGTGGNALFLVETLKSLLEQGILAPSDTGGWVLPPVDQALLPPASVQELVGARLARLVPASRAVIELVAVLGEDADFSILSRVGDLELVVLSSVLEELRQRGFLAECGTGYRFEHDAVREIVYEGVAQKRRLRLHQKAGEILEDRHAERVESLAYHFRLAGVWDKAASYGRQAGDRARMAHATVEAVTHYTQALEALEKSDSSDLALRLELLLAREMVNDLRGERGTQARDLEQMGALLEKMDDGSPQAAGKRAVVALRRANYYDVTSDYRAAKETAQEAIESATCAGEPAMEAEGYIALGRVAWLQANYGLARAHYERALALVQAIGDRRREGVCLHKLGVCHDELDEYLEAVDCQERALAIFRELGEQQREAECLNSLANAYDGMGESAAAQGYYEQSLAIKRTIGDRRGESMVLYNLSVYHRDRGDGETARRYCEQALVIARDIDDRRLEAYVLTYLGLILECLHAPELLSEADFAVAGEYYAEALTIRREIGQLALAVDCEAGLARVALAQGQIPEALGYVEETLGWIAEHGVAGIGDIQLVYLTAHRAFLSAGLVEQAGAVIDEAHRLLLAWAEGLSAEATQRLFKNVWPNGEIVAIHRALQTGALARRVQARLPRVDAPAGRPLCDDEWVNVTWTVASLADDAVCDKTERRRHRLLRLMHEAAEQSAAPTVEALATALKASERTIKRDLAALRAKGHDVRTRGARA